MRKPDARILAAAGVPADQLAAIDLAPRSRRGEPARMKKPGRGGARAGAGRPTKPKPTPIYVHAPAELRDRITAVLDPGESLSAFGLVALEKEATERERNR
jgi:hypothetical protein